MDKQAAWETLKQQAAEHSGSGTVFGEGPLDARLTIVSEAPGQQEVEAERPFVGRAGRLLWLSTFHLQNHFFQKRAW